MIDRYYEPGEPKGRPYFFYFLVPQLWNEGGTSEFYSMLVNPNSKPSFLRKILGLEHDPTEGRIKVWRQLFKGYKERFGISSFDSFEDGSWLDVQGKDEEEANKIVRDLFFEISRRSIPKFPIEIEISDYNEENRRLLYIVTPYTESHAFITTHFKIMGQFIIPYVKGPMLKRKLESSLA